MNKYIRHIVVLLFILFPCNTLYAQTVLPDIGTLIALVNDHRRVRKVLQARALLEESNKKLHESSKDANLEYDSLNLKLDKYMMCFDIIDVIYNGAVCVVNATTTAKNISEEVKDMSKMLKDFTEKCVMRGDILSSDTIISNTCIRCITMIVGESEELIKSIIELSQYASGLRSITTTILLLVIDEINDTLNNIRRSIDHCYYVVWKYIYMRLHYFKPRVFQARNIHEMAADALERWLEVAKKTGY